MTEIPGEETCVDMVDVKQEKDVIASCTIEPVVKTELVEVGTEADGKQLNITNTHNQSVTVKKPMAPSGIKRKFAPVIAKNVKVKKLSPGEAMLRCFNIFNIPTKKIFQMSKKPSIPWEKKKVRRPPPGLIPIEGQSKPNGQTDQNGSWEGQANDSGEVILSGAPTFDLFTKFSEAGILSSHESAEISEKSLSLTPNMKVFRCTICNYITNRTNNLNRHYNSMHKTLVSPEECCEIVFYTRADLTKHNKICHPDSKFPCQYPGCQGYVFDRKALLKRHVLAVHLKDKPFLCPLCTYGSSHKSNLDRHIKTIHGIDPTQDPNAASALSVPSAGVLEGQNLDSVEDFRYVGLMMDRSEDINNSLYEEDQGLVTVKEEEDLIEEKPFIDIIPHEDQKTIHI